MSRGGCHFRKGVTPPKNYPCVTAYLIDSEAASDQLNTERLNVTSRDRAKEAANQAASTVLNINRDFNCKAISKGLEPPGVPRYEGGWYAVSFHIAGMRSAWVKQARLRKAYPDLDTKVVRVLDHEWTAEIRVRRKTEAEQ